MNKHSITACAFSLSLLIVSGCGDASRSREAISDFELKTSEGYFTHDIYIKFTGHSDLNSVEVALKIDAEKGALPEEKRIWATWKAGETKTINVSASNGSMQRYQLFGKAFQNGEYVRLWNAWRNQ